MVHLRSMHFTVIIPLLANIKKQNPEVGKGGRKHIKKNYNIML